MIVTALAEEQDAVLAVLGDVPSGTAVVDGLRVAVESLHGMGNPGAAGSGGTVLARWGARRLLLVGIAGGIGAAGVGFGDVLVPDQIVGYESGKVRDDGVLRRPEVYRPDFTLLTAARAVRPADWAPARPVHVGTVLSGEKVIASREVLDELRAGWPRAVGVEMESLGTALAAYRAGGGFLMVKGVSDLADAGKDDRWRGHAADAAARFTLALLRRLAAAAGDLEVPGSVRLLVCQRLVGDWQRLAIYFDIPAYERAAFARGPGPDGVWDWLVARQRLRELPDALDFIGRADLTAELRDAR
ncbi:hypothetical protein Asi02nite_47140 [Asanoa siamensis]|uniref:Uncharacterized protein n=1 Tax=Asanoa siamensis TaxID=926357 RepID=A0ABQ4CV89_9ACTN|nr:hypothetical protein Asi02nite_47140 [Asanoa siamensis]